MARDEMVPKGYDEEERYFHEREQELLRRKREELDAARRRMAQEQAPRHEHWMKCPKCGSDLQEVEMEGVMVDRCGQCEGVFFDRGELELLVGDRGGLVSRLARLFRR